jgi:hypothetical protein
MRLPAIDQHGTLIGQWIDRVVDNELRIGALDLEQARGNADGRHAPASSHVEKRNSSKRSMRDAQCVRHLLLYQGCGGSRPAMLRRSIELPQSRLFCPNPSA